MIAALYDIHGNLAALEAVLAEVPDEAATSRADWLDRVEGHAV